MTAIVRMMAGDDKTKGQGLGSVVPESDHAGNASSMATFGVAVNASTAGELWCGGADAGAGVDSETGFGSLTTAEPEGPRLSAVPTPRHLVASATAAHPMGAASSDGAAAQWLRAMPETAFAARSNFAGVFSTCSAGGSLASRAGAFRTTVGDPEDPVARGEGTRKELGSIMHAFLDPVLPGEDPEVLVAPDCILQPLDQDQTTSHAGSQDDVDGQTVPSMVEQIEALGQLGHESLLSGNLHASEGARSVHEAEPCNGVGSPQADEVSKEPLSRIALAQGLATTATAEEVSMNATDIGVRDLSTEAERRTARSCAGLAPIEEEGPTSAWAVWAASEIADLGERHKETSHSTRLLEEHLLEVVLHTVELERNLRISLDAQIASIVAREEAHRQELSREFFDALDGRERSLRAEITARIDSVAVRGEEIANDIAKKLNVESTVCIQDAASFEKVMPNALAKAESELQRVECLAAGVRRTCEELSDGMVQLHVRLAKDLSEQHARAALDIAERHLKASRAFDARIDDLTLTQPSCRAPPAPAVFEAAQVCGAGPSSVEEEARLPCMLGQGRSAGRNVPAAAACAGPPPWAASVPTLEWRPRVAALKAALRPGEASVHR
mmetsp:Transcript_12115/g.27184  ORF Transcript_12115/g.27184 Transcript_12115/m.27184 type:complete len:615 (+) Transcript_12115:58-1902(+)